MVKGFAFNGRNESTEEKKLCLESKTHQYFSLCRFFSQNMKHSLCLCACVCLSYIIYIIQETCFSRLIVDLHFRKSLLLNMFVNFTFVCMHHSLSLSPSLPCDCVCICVCFQTVVCCWVFSSVKQPGYAEMSTIVGINCLAQACCLSTGHLPPIPIDLILSCNEFLCLSVKWVNWRERGGNVSY